jgi:hypothetical protein
MSDDKIQGIHPPYHIEDEMSDIILDGDTTTGGEMTTEPDESIFEKEAAELAQLAATYELLREHNDKAEEEVPETFKPLANRSERRAMSRKARKSQTRNLR